MKSLNILMVAAENDALPGTKVGGVGDVIRDLPKSLLEQGCEVACVIPSYGFLARRSDMEKCAEIEVQFAGKLMVVEVLRQKCESNEVVQWVLHHADFAPQGETVYCHDGNDRPFATDATKFAFFCQALAQALLLEAIPKPDVIHCHDWHSAFLLILLRFSSSYTCLSSIRTVYTIHNLAMQGVRPFRGDSSSFQTWYPSLIVDPREIADPALPHCVNPMRAGVRLADKVHTVSPQYAEEILRPSDVVNGIYGGEGLEEDLLLRANEGRLFGILNGCVYEETVKAPKKPSKAMLVKQTEQSLMSWVIKERYLASAHWLAEKRLKSWATKRKPGILISSVGRVTDQKVRLLNVELEKGKTALDCLLEALGSKGQFIMLGSGDADLEQGLVEASARHNNFLFLMGFSLPVSEMLYTMGDLFLMPSSFEPCGISQLLAMKAGQPCLVNYVGGLKNTVEPGKTGFAFRGDSLKGQAQAMVDSFKHAVSLYESEPEQWKQISKEASERRFTWQTSSKTYIEQLYT